VFDFIFVINVQTKIIKNYNYNKIYSINYFFKIKILQKRDGQCVLNQVIISP
jgi:hypothetical protein